MASIYDTPADLNLIQTYVPLPFEEMARGLEAKQGRYDETAAKIPEGAEALKIPAAGAADRDYIASLQEGYAKDVVEEFPYGQVDLTDPNVSSKLNRKIHEYTNRPEFLTVASNAEVYPELREAVQRAMIEQPDSVWNYSDAAGTLNIFDQYGTQAVGDLTNVAIAEPADVPGTLYDILNNFKASGDVKERDLTALRTRFKSEGVLPDRIGLAFDIDLKTGEAKNGMPTWFKGNPIGQELTRMARHILSNDEEVTSDNFNEKYQETLTSLYEDTVTNLLNAYAYDKTEDIQGLGSLLSMKGYELDQGPTPLTHVPRKAARGLNAFNEVEGQFEQSNIDRLLLNRIEEYVGNIGGKENSVDDIAANMFYKHLVGESGSESKRITPDDVEIAVEKGRREFVNSITTPIEVAVLGDLSVDPTSVAKVAIDAWSKAKHTFYKNTWGDMVENYAETLYDTILQTYDEAAPYIQSEESNFTLIRTEEKYDSEYGPGEFRELSSADKARFMNKELFKHVSELKKIHTEGPSYREDAKKYNEKLANSVFGTHDSKDPLYYEAKTKGDAPGILGGNTGFDEDGNEYNFAENISEGDGIRLLGRLSVNNPYEPGFFLVNIQGKNVFVQGSSAEQADQYLGWHLHGHSRAFNGISKDIFQQNIGGDNYEMRTVDDARTGMLRIDYREPGSDKWQSYSGPENNIIDLYTEFYREFNQ